MSTICVFFPTYNEAGNVQPLVRGIHEQLPDARILVVDDASQDGTAELLDGMAAEDSSLEVIHRPRKLGVGSAHKLAMLKARDRGDRALITMDADFSHHPRYLPTMVERLNHSEFVTGSRYAPGGRCDYGPYRQLVSRTANLAARGALGLRLAENTTLYRGFTRSLLARLPIDRIKSDGYSFAVESLFEVAAITSALDEFPIHFEDRLHGDSKISKKEIYKAIATIGRLGLERVNPRSTRGVLPTAPRKRSACVGCHSTYNLELYAAREGQATHGAYSVSSHSKRTHGRILSCLQCGLIYMEPRLTADELVRAYEEVEDQAYLEHAAARVQTFEFNLRQVEHHLAGGDRVLDVGSHCGVFLKVAEERGIDITGVEPSRWAVDAARQLTSQPIVHGTVADLPPQTRPFDVVTMWDVLEHLYDPEAELRRIGAVLKPGGTLMLSTLMIDNWFPRLMGRSWPWLMDMHLYYFTQGSLADMLGRAGFRIVESRSYCHIITLDYLMTKLGSLGVPGVESLGRLLEQTRPGKALIPFRFGDIQLFVCKKVDGLDGETGRARAVPKLRVV
ncbi:MAG: methyltransferase domain-containing protein [Myxococcales bacterium]|nr:methyltransferase domain-containing protein [Myxococcales bacterium]